MEETDQECTVEQKPWGLTSTVHVHVVTGEVHVHVFLWQYPREKNVNAKDCAATHLNGKRNHFLTGRLAQWDSHSDTPNLGKKTGPSHLGQ